MNSLSSRFVDQTWRMLGLRVILVGLISAISGCYWNIFAELERKCEEHAEIIVYNADLWGDFVEAGDQAYQERLIEYPNTRRAFIEFVPDFSFKYGQKLKDSPRSIDGEINREDMFIVQNKQVVAQFVNFFARQDFGGSTVGSCVAHYPNFYHVRQVSTNSYGDSLLNIFAGAGYAV